MGQRSEFEYSERTSRAEAQANVDSREQSGEARAQSQPADYVAAQPMGDQKIYPQRRRRRRRWLWFVALLLVIILALVIGSNYFPNSVFGKTQSLPQQTFSVSGTPNLVINDAAGRVTIQRGDSNQVTVKATARGGIFSNLSNDTVDAKQNGNTIDILAGQDGSVFNHGSVDLVITLPANSNIQATVNLGSMDINGVSGQMNIKVDTGALNFENGTIEGQSSFKDNTGAINFNGEIAANGDYDFENNVGAINLTLPSTVPFALDVSSNMGKVNNDFGSGNDGSNASSNVHVHTDVGAVNIHRR